MAFKTNTVSDLHNWDNFKAWCVKTLNMHDFEEIAFQQLTELKQTGTVIAYKSKFAVLALRVGVTPQQQLKYLYDGLKPEIVRDTRFDPVTRSKYETIGDAQAVALAADSFSTDNTTSTSGHKRGRNSAVGHVDLTVTPTITRPTDQGRRPTGNSNAGNPNTASGSGSGSGSGFRMFIRGTQQRYKVLPGWW